jgi:hypothetical protein
MVMAVSFTRVAWHEFLQCTGAQEFDIRSDVSLLRLKNTETGAIEFMKCPSADASNHDCVHLLTGKSRYRITSAMLMDLVHVVERSYFVGDYIDHDKTRGRPEMVIHLAL